MVFEVDCSIFCHHFHLLGVNFIEDITLVEGLDQDMTEAHSFDTVAHNFKLTWHVRTRKTTTKSRVKFAFPLFMELLFAFINVVITIVSDVFIFFSEVLFV